MQGTSLDEVFGTFISNLTTSQFHTMRLPLAQIPDRDLSGASFHDLSPDELIKEFSEEIPPLDTNVLQLRVTLDDYKVLKEQHKYLVNEINELEKNLKDLQTVNQNAYQATEDYTKTVLRNRILSTEEFNTLQEKQQELFAYQKETSSKCFIEYNNQIRELSSKLRKVQNNMQAYSEFIKTGVKEMVGPDTKPTSCSICFENDITHCFVPCGHTFCGGCIDKSNTKKCMNCRSDVQKTIKIFLGV